MDREGFYSKAIAKYFTVLLIRIIFIGQIKMIFLIGKSKLLEQFNMLQELIQLYLSRISILLMNQEC